MQCSSFSSEICEKTINTCYWRKDVSTVQEFESPYTESVKRYNSISKERKKIKDKKEGRKEERKKERKAVLQSKPSHEKEIQIIVVLMAVRMFSRHKSHATKQRKVSSFLLFLPFYSFPSCLLRQHASIHCNIVLLIRAIPTSFGSFDTSIYMPLHDHSTFGFFDT